MMELYLWVSNDNRMPVVQEEIEDLMQFQSRNPVTIHGVERQATAPGPGHPF